MHRYQEQCHMEGNRRTIQPWLLYWNDQGAEEIQTFCTISDSDPTKTKTYSGRIPELGAANLWSVQQGWFLFENYYVENVIQLFLWNPSNLKKIELPPLKHNAAVRDGDPILRSTDQEVCSVLIFSSSTSIFFWILGDQQWTEVDYQEQLMSAPTMEGEEFSEGLISLGNPFYYNGRLYAESGFQPHLLVEIKEQLEPRGLKINSSHIFYPHLPQSCIGWTFQMLESNNELFRIEILHADDKVSAVVVHKLDFPRKEWRKVENIKDKVFFISNGDISSSFASEVVNPEIEGGRVYISLKKHNFVYIYNIEDKSFMISRPFLNLPQWSDTCWLKQDPRMIDSIKEVIRKTRIREKESNDEIYSKKKKPRKLMNEFMFQQKEKTKDTITNDEFALPLDRVDIVEAIAKHINIGIDYLHFRATNRFFHSSTPPIQWRSSSAISMSRFDHFSVSPLFVYFEKHNVLTFVHPKNGLKYKYNSNLTMDLQSHCEICYSKDGWLLVVVDKTSSFFFNPFAKEQEKSLANGDNLNTRCIAFSHPPTSSECVVVDLVKVTGNPRMVSNITCPGRNNWEWFDFEDLNFLLYNISPAFHKGAFHYLNNEGKLGVLKVEKVEEGEGLRVGWDVLERLYAPCTNYSNSFLLECNDNLLSVFEGPFGEWVRVFKLNESTMTWIQVENLENYMLFIGQTSFSAVAHVQGMENKIYFPRFYHQNIVFYSLETNNYHTFESNEVVDFHSMEEKVNSTWIEPRWH